MCCVVVIEKLFQEVFESHLIFYPTPQQYALWNLITWPGNEAIQVCKLNVTTPWIYCNPYRYYCWSKYFNKNAICNCPLLTDGTMSVPCTNDWLQTGQPGVDFGKVNGNFSHHHVWNKFWAHQTPYHNYSCFHFLVYAN